MQGFLLFDYEERYAEARNDIYAWLTSGKMTSLQDEVSGLGGALLNSPLGSVQLR